MFLLGILWLEDVKQIEIDKPFCDMEYQGSLKDGPDKFIVYLDDKGVTRWYRVIVIDENIQYISYYPCLMEREDEVLIRVRWDPSKYVDCKTFLRIAEKYNGLVGKGRVAFCQRYHLPLNKIKAVCGELCSDNNNCKYPDLF